MSPSNPDGDRGGFELHRTRHNVECEQIDIKYQNASGPNAETRTACPNAILAVFCWAVSLSRPSLCSPSRSLNPKYSTLSLCHTRQERKSRHSPQIRQPGSRISHTLPDPWNAQGLSGFELPFRPPEMTPVRKRDRDSRYKKVFDVDVWRKFVNQEKCNQIAINLSLIS